jgi:hypothetical protein
MAIKAARQRHPGASRADRRLNGGAGPRRFFERTRLFATIDAQLSR